MGKGTDQYRILFYYKRMRGIREATHRLMRRLPLKENLEIRGFVVRITKLMKR